MSKTKNRLEEERINAIESHIKDGNFDHIYLFTNIEARATDSNSDFYYQVYGDIGGLVCKIEIRDVQLARCECNSCVFEGPELDECISIRSGLGWTLEKFGTVPIWLWVSSQQFIEGVDKGFQNYPVSCDFQRQLIDDIGALFGKLDIRIDEYSYVNKDMIPVFVEGKMLTGIKRSNDEIS